MTRSTGKNNRTSAGDRAKKFGDLAGRVDVAGIKELSKSDPKAAYIAAQEMEKELLKEQAVHNAQAAEQAAQSSLGNEINGKPEDEMKAEKGLELHAKLPFQKKQQLQNVQALKTEIANEISAEHSFRNRSTPTPGGS